MGNETKLSRCRLQPDRPISMQIYEFLRAEITSTKIMPGTSISENELSSHFKVSRQPVREAIMRLRLDGLLKVIPQKGSIVQKISVSNLKQICFIRTAIECASIANASKLEDREIADLTSKLELNLRQQEQVVSADEDEMTALFLALDDEFHRLLCSLSTCPMAWDTIQSIKPQMDRIRYLSQGGVSPYEQLIDEHKRILFALRERDFDGARAHLDQHLHEIMKTFAPIREQYAQWFLSEDEDF